MQQTALPYQDSANRSLTPTEFKENAAGWLLDCEMRQCSEATLEKRRLIVKCFLWFLEAKKIPLVNHVTVRQFLVYVDKGHLEPGGRWGNARNNKPVKPAYVQMYFSELRALFNWIVEEERLAISPMAKLKPPIDRPDDVQPFALDQVESLLKAAGKSKHPTRDLALVLLLFDTGVRISEACGLRYGHTELTPAARSIKVEGKGGKTRVIPIGARTARALYKYLNEEFREADDFVFWSDAGKETGAALTRSGALQLIRRLGRSVGITNVRVNPHTFRHTFAIEFLRSGGNQFTLMTILGHTDMKMTARYVKIAEADVMRQHRHHSPADRLNRRVRS